MIGGPPTGIWWRVQNPTCSTVRSFRLGVYNREVLKNKSCQQIDRVVARCIASSTVVVRLSAIEPQVARVLHCQVDVLRRPPGSVQGVAVALRRPVGASRNRSLGEK